MSEGAKIIQLPLRMGSRPITGPSSYTGLFRNGYVYFAQQKGCEEGKGPPVKIGWSMNPWSRVHEGNCWYPHGSLSVIRVYRGTQDDERECHRRFAHLRIRGEWFRPASELAEYINGLPAESVD